MPGDKPPGGKREEFKIAEFTGESPTIQLVPGSKKRKALEDKLEQYREREAQEAAQGVKNADTFCVIVMAEILLRGGSVNKVKLFEELQNMYPQLRTYAFRSACSVIEKTIQEIM